MAFKLLNFVVLMFYWWFFFVKHVIMRLIWLRVLISCYCIKLPSLCIFVHDEGCLILMTSHQYSKDISTILLHNKILEHTPYTGLQMKCTVMNSIIELLTGVKFLSYIMDVQVFIGKIKKLIVHPYIKQVQLVHETCTPCTSNKYTIYIKHDFA